MHDKVELSVERSNEDTSSIKSLVLSTQKWLVYLTSKWYFIVIFGILGAFVGFIYAKFQKPNYTAVTSFVLESGGKSGGLGAYSGLASTFGIDIGGGSGGLFDGENIIELYKSRNMITKALLSPIELNGSRKLLIDRYIEFNKLRENWNRKPELGAIQFQSNNIYATPKAQLVHDSILGTIVKSVTAGLTVGKKDKKLNLIHVSTNFGDEVFTKLFNDHLVETVNDFYLETKRKKNLENVSILQAKTDSVRRNMAGAISRAATVADATPNQNPTRLAQRIVPMENAKVNAEINETVLSSLLQNLELSKIALVKETPLIQIVDAPILPLEEKKIGKLIGLIVGGIVGGFLITVILLIRKIILDILK